MILNNIKPTMLKIYSLNNNEDAQKYASALNNFESNHPYYKVEFLDIFYSGLSKARAFVYYDVNEEPLIAMPFYLREINEELKLDLDDTYFDVISTWGYSGPIYNKTTSSETLKQFWSEVDNWYKNNNVVSEFVRFNPSDNQDHYSGDLVTVMNIIKGKLLDIETIWTNYNRKVRKNINKAKREELYSKLFFEDAITDQVIDDFYAIYKHTMDRTNATESYYNSKEKLTHFMRSCPKNSVIALTYKGDIPISSEIILLSEDSLFSFIGGTLSEYFNFRPNEILKHDVIEWGFNQGYKFYVLGGGLGKEDGIYSYKKAFFPEDTHPFITGRKVIDNVIYKRLSKEKVAENDDDTDFFPLYRKN